MTLEPTGGAFMTFSGTGPKFAVFANGFWFGSPPRPPTLTSNLIAPPAAHLSPMSSWSRKAYAESPSFW